MKQHYNADNVPSPMKRILKSLSFSIIHIPVLILFFFVAFNFMDYSPTPTGWYQQWFPNLNGRYIVDITFTDSLNGCAITNKLSLADTSFILKTSNGGDNWLIVYRETTNYSSLSRVQFINQNTGFVVGYIPHYYILKTTNAGLNWFYSNAPGDFVISDISALNEDTIWVCGSNGFYDAVLRTTNGGTSWQQQHTWGSLQNTNIYMYNTRIGFASLSFPAGIWKTTNGGLNWSNVINESFNKMYFIDSLNGWKTNGILKKTIDGGLNWVTQVMPSGGYIFSNQVFEITSINKDTLWGVGGYMQFEYPPLRLRGIIYKTTNGGINWGYQLPDTHTVTCTGYTHVSFVNKLIGWVYNGYTGAYTNIGGDPITYFGIQQIGNEIPKDFILKQNYPNPFNPRTIISYGLKSPANVKLIAYDILGEEVQILVDHKQQAGEYQVDFMGKFSASGIYFYSLFVDNKLIDTKKMILLK